MEKQAMPENEKNTLTLPSRATSGETAKRKSRLTRLFVDKYIEASAEITPKWQRAIDTYNRAKKDDAGR